MSSWALLARASRDTAKPSRYLPRSETCSTNPRASSTAVSRDTVDFVYADLLGDLGDPRLAHPGQDLQDQQRAIDRLYGGGRVVTLDQCL